MKKNWIVVVVGVVPVQMIDERFLDQFCHSCSHANMMVDTDAVVASPSWLWSETRATET